MRVSRTQAEANREAVINVASRLFREKGFDGIGLKDLMKGAGLTPGGFYKQFASKQDLEAYASERAISLAIGRWRSAALSNPDPLRGIVDFYLSTRHRSELGEGCPLVALGSDAARQTAEVRKPFEEGIDAHLKMLEETLPAGGDPGEAPEKAMVMLALMVGAVSLSRNMADEQRAAGMLEAASTAILRLAREKPTSPPASE